jgi:hypothetical protein
LFIPDHSQVRKVKTLGKDRNKQANGTKKKTMKIHLSLLEDGFDLLLFSSLKNEGKE